MRKEYHTVIRVTDPDGFCEYIRHQDSHYVSAGYYENRYKSYSSADEAVVINQFVTEE